MENQNIQNTQKTAENKANPQFTDVLAKAGLNETEGLLYRLLLSSGPVGIKPLMSDSGLKRGNAYYHLDRLIEKGLAEKIDAPGKPVQFCAKHPENLELLLAKEKNRLLEAESLLNNQLPQMRSLYQLISSKPGVKFYEGKEGIITIYEDLLSLGNNIDSFEDKGEMTTFIPDYAKEFIAKRVKKNIFNRVIAPSTNPVNINSKAELRETRFVPAQEFPFRMDVKISGQAVSLISFQKENPVGILVENKEIAENFQMLFQLVWQLLGSKAELSGNPKQT